MSPEFQSGLFTLSGVIVGGAITYLTQWRVQKHQFKMLLEEIKTVHMAETTAKKYLDHVKFKQRSFEFLKERMGGFSDDGLRQILIRAGAVRYMREDKEKKEWWMLLDEYRKNKITDESEENVE